MDKAKVIEWLKGRAESTPMPGAKSMYQAAYDLLTQDATDKNDGCKSKWISVKERLPENDYGKHWQERKQYLVFLQNGTMRVARYGYKEYDWWIGSQDVVLHEKHYTGVTHWMPLPETPEGGAEE